MSQRRIADSIAGLADERGRRSFAVIKFGVSEKRTFPGVIRHVVSLSQAGLAETFDDAIKLHRILIR